MTMRSFDYWRVSEEAEAVRAELMLRGVIAVREVDGLVAVTSASEELAERVLEELLPEKEIRWLGPTNHRIVPARILSYEYFPVNTIYLTVDAGAHEHVDSAYVAEDADKVVVAAFKCSPLLCEHGPPDPQLERVLLDGYLDDRPVIDALTGEGLPPVRGTLDT